MNEDLKQLIGKTIADAKYKCAGEVLILTFNDNSSIEIDSSGFNNEVYIKFNNKS